MTRDKFSRFFFLSVLIDHALLKIAKFEIRVREVSRKSGYEHGRQKTKYLMTLVFSCYLCWYVALVLPFLSLFIEHDRDKFERFVFREKIFVKF